MEIVPASVQHLPDLPAIRQTKGISLEQIAAISKINIRYLKAIELGQFDKLPGGIFNTSYIRQYARAIEFEEAELLAYYNSQAGVNGRGN